MVTYEWDVEELEEEPSISNDFDPDIFDHNFCDTYAECRKTLDDLVKDGRFGRIVLVRHVGDDLEGETDRAWSYLKDDNTLPETFVYGADEDSGIRVPKRFHDEVRKGN